jgi:sec-independent protein translocase protein TatA
MGIGVTELLLILGIVVLLFGTRKLKDMGGDLGGAIKNFRSAMSQAEDPALEAKSLEGKPAEGTAVSPKDKAGGGAS